MSALISLGLRAAPVCASLYFYSTSGSDAAKGKPVQGVVRAGFGWGAKMVSSLFESAESVAHIGKATALAASSTLCVAGIQNLRKALNEKSTSKVLKGVVQLTVGGVASGLTALSDSGIASNLQNSLTLAGMSAVLICEGAVNLYKGRSGFLRLTVGAAGLGYALASILPQSASTSV